jgi:hypothetical protein
MKLFGAKKKNPKSPESHPTARDSELKMRPQPDSLQTEEQA